MTPASSLGSAQRSSNAVVPVEDASDVKQEAMRKAFDKIDVDHSGKIDHSELGDLLREQGNDITDEQVRKVLKSLAHDEDINHDEDDNTINFEEFAMVLHNVADVDGDGNISFDEIMDHLVTSTMNKYAGMFPPIYEELSKDSSRYKVSMALDGTKAQIVVLFCVVIDVIAVMMELLLVATACTPKNSAQSSWENALHYISVAILYILATQLVLLMFCYGVKFFKRPSYVADLVIVVLAIVLETLHYTAGPLFVTMLLWRFLRVIHGFLTSVEHHLHLAHRKVTKMETTHHEAHHAHASDVEDIWSLCNNVNSDKFIKIDNILQQREESHHELTASEMELLVHDFYSFRSTLKDAQVKLLGLKQRLHSSTKRHGSKH